MDKWVRTLRLVSADASRAANQIYCENPDNLKIEDAAHWADLSNELMVKLMSLNVITLSIGNQIVYADTQKTRINGFLKIAEQERFDISRFKEETKRVSPAAFREYQKIYGQAWDDVDKFLSENNG